MRHLDLAGLQNSGTTSVVVTDNQLAPVKLLEHGQVILSAPVVFVTGVLLDMPVVLGVGIVKQAGRWFDGE